MNIDLCLTMSDPSFKLKIKNKSFTKLDLLSSFINIENYKTSNKVYFAGNYTKIPYCKTGYLDFFHSAMERIPLIAGRTSLLKYRRNID